MKRSSCEFLAHVEKCEQCRLNVEVIKRTKRPQREKENSVCYYALISPLSVLLCRCKLQCFGGLFPLSAYLIRLVTAAEEWKSTPPRPPPQLSDTSALRLPASATHIQAISRHLLSTQRFKSRQSAVLAMCETLSAHSRRCGRVPASGGQKSPAGCLTGLQSYARSLHFIKQDKVSGPGGGIRFTGIPGTPRR